MRVLATATYGAVLLALAPVVDASPTPAAAEVHVILDDPRGDVEGHAPGAKDHDSVDILEGSLTVDDAWLLTLRTTASRAWHEPDDSTLECNVQAERLVDGSRTGFVRWAWHRPPRDATIRSQLTWNPAAVQHPGTAGSPSPAESERIPHAFSSGQDADNWFLFNADLDDLRSPGARLEQFYATCARGNSIALPGVTRVTDSARSSPTIPIEFTSIANDRGPGPLAAPLPTLAVGAGLLSALLFAAAKRLWTALPAWILAPGREIRPHPQRARILELLRTGGPDSIAGLARALACNRGTLRYHLRRLERAGRVTATNIGREKLWSTEQGSPGSPMAARGETRRRILARLRTGGAPSVRLLARELGLGRSTVHHHLQKLIRGGLVRRIRAGTPNRYQVNEATGAGGA